ncbi:piggybac transposable element-derived protein 4 [Holotrichia oblita]|uniref:Piggybac transposable element-derived protein 4 n=1 Tax=Holotrichia oblita TaxID=644536 RepID=A0ACB9TJC7_HOLOL|nr:piggybac transposable element-derived protein 4 [Holotrichia oblita]
MSHSLEVTAQVKGGRQNVRTGGNNIIIQMPGGKGEARKKRTPIEIWNLFITNDILERIVVYTNTQIELKTYSARATDLDELKALSGLLYIVGVMKSSHQNIIDLCKNNGMGLEIFRLKMSVERFKFLLQTIRLDDKITRLERRELDKLSAVREFFDAFNGNLPKYFSPSQYTTVDERRREVVGFGFIQGPATKRGRKIIRLFES